MNAAPHLLEVVGCGSVSPVGCTVDALWETEPPHPVHEPLLSNPAQFVGVRRVNLRQEALVGWEKEARLRRASPLAYFMTEAANQAMKYVPEILPGRLALVCALGTGSVIYSRRFYSDALKKGRHFASPLLFPETVYNSPVSHVASTLNISGPCYTLMGDETAWTDALRVAMVWFARDVADAVLVVGGEELDTIALEAYKGSGWIRRGLIATEGAGAIVVRKPVGRSPCVIKVDAPPVFFRSRQDQRNAWKKIFTKYGIQENLLLPSNITPPDLLKNIPGASDVARLKNDLGFAFTASSAWAFIQAVEYRKQHPPFNLVVAGANTALSVISFV